MKKIVLLLFASAAAMSASAQTGVVNPRTIADHGTPAMHAEESAKNVAASKASAGLNTSTSRQQAVKDTTKVADHGTQTLHAEEAQKNVATSRAETKAIGSNKAAQEAVVSATKGATR